MAIDRGDLEFVAVGQGLVAFEAVVDLHQDLSQAGAVRQGVNAAERIDARRARADQAAQPRGEVAEVFLQAVQTGAVAREQGEDAGEDGRGGYLRLLSPSTKRGSSWWKWKHLSR